MRFCLRQHLKIRKTCQLVIELVLGRPVGPVKVRVERSILFSKDFRYVRLDVCARDEADISYNVEMHNSHKAELPKRSRYHQAQLDVASLKPGQSFLELRPSYVIFICTYDPFDRNLYRYTYEERCIETGMSLGDETQKIFLNTKGTNDSDVPVELIHFLNYVENSTDSFAEKTHGTGVHNHKPRKPHQIWKKIYFQRSTCVYYNRKASKNQSGAKLKLNIFTPSRPNKTMGGLLCLI